MSEPSIPHFEAVEEMARSCAVAGALSFQLQLIMRQLFCASNDLVDGTTGPWPSTCIQASFLLAFPQIFTRAILQSSNAASIHSMPVPPSVEGTSGQGLCNGRRSTC